MADMRVALVSPERVVWQGEADFVLARSVEGDIGVLPRHAPLLAALVPGVVRIRTGGEVIVASVEGGFLSVSDDGVSILAEGAQLADEIDVSAAQSELSEAQAALTSADDSAGAVRVRIAEAKLRAAGQTV